MSYVIASSKDWFDMADRAEEFSALDFHLMRTREDLDPAILEKLAPRFIFFVHWNWIVPPEIFERYACVVFHTAPLPFGRGGSPIQNLIVRGIDHAPVCALKMTGTLDGGPIYASLDVALEGTIEQIFERIAAAVEQLILTIVRDEPTPVEQVGTPVYFKRRTPAESEIPSDCDLSAIYDRIRMVDGLDYPRAFVRLGSHRIEFFDASIQDGELLARVRIIENGYQTGDAE